MKLPVPIADLLAVHLGEHAGPCDDALIFTGARGAALQRNNFNTSVSWAGLVVALGVPGLHFHDLRH